MSSNNNLGPINGPKQFAKLGSPPSGCIWWNDLYVNTAQNVEQHSLNLSLLIGVGLAIGIGGLILGGIIVAIVVKCHTKILDHETIPGHPTEYNSDNEDSWIPAEEEPI